jgi:hypothetical protein
MEIFRFIVGVALVAVTFHYIVKAARETDVWKANRYYHQTTLLLICTMWYMTYFN